MNTDDDIITPSPLNYGKRDLRNCLNTLWQTFHFTKDHAQIVHRLYCKMHFKIKVLDLFSILDLTVINEK